MIERDLACGSVGLHTGIGLFMGLSSFSMAMMCMLVSFFPPELVRQLCEGVAARMGRLFAGRSRVGGAKAGELVLSR